MAERRAAKRPARRARAARPAPFEGVRDLMRKMVETRPDFFEHLSNSRVEFWKAIRSLIDQRIESLERGRARLRKREITRVKVSE